MDHLCENYEQWKHCITVLCGISLTKTFLSKRIGALSNLRDPTTARFVTLYGEPHRARTVQWFQQALAELQGGSSP